MEIQVKPHREFRKEQQFDPLQLANCEGGFNLYHKGCGGAVDLVLDEKTRRLLVFPISTKLWYRFSCTRCKEEYEVELRKASDLSDECAFTRQCLRRVLIEKKGPFGSSARLNFHYLEP